MFLRNIFVVLIFAFSSVNARCPNACSGHGSCGANDKCTCYLRAGADSNEPAWVFHDCSGRSCPKDIAWIGEIVDTNNAHPRVECSNAGICDRKSGECTCFANYEGIACERTVCPNKCSGAGVCYSQYQIAYDAEATYQTPWDAKKSTGCVCDKGRRGPDCSLVECPTGIDVLKGDGGEQGRDCSGRGTCDYTQGICTCGSGYFGTRCEYQTVLN